MCKRFCLTAVVLPLLLLAVYAPTSSSAATAPVNAPPVAKITASVTSGSTPLTVYFSGEGSYDPEGTPVRYEWWYPDGETDVGPTSTYTFTVPGKNVVSLVVYDAQFVKTVATVAIGVAGPGGNLLPQVTTKVTSPSFTSPSTVTFAATGKDSDGQALTYSWAFWDGTSATGASVTRRFSTPGTYFARAIVTDSGGLSVWSGPVFFTIRPNRPPVPVLSWNPKPVTYGYMIWSGETSFDPDGQSITFRWAFSDGTTMSGPAVKKRVTTAGPLTATLTVLDSGGRSASIKKTVTVTPAEAKFASMYVNRSSTKLPTSLYAVIKVTDVNGTPLSGVTFTGKWGDQSATVVGTTDIFGSAKIWRTGVTQPGSYTFQALNIVVPGGSFNGVPVSSTIVIK